MRKIALPFTPSEFEERWKVCGGVPRQWNMTEDMNRLVTIQKGQAARVKPEQFFDQSLQEGVSSHVAMLVPTTDRSVWLTTWFVSDSAMELCYKAVMHAAGVDRHEGAIAARRDPSLAAICGRYYELWLPPLGRCFRERRRRRATP